MFCRADVLRFSLNESGWHYYSAEVEKIGYGMRRWAIAGFVRGGFQGNARAYTIRDDYWTVPYWFLLVVAIVIPSIWIAGWYRRRTTGSRSQRRACTSRGYDLRATPLVCPECGRSAIPAAAKPPATADCGRVA